MSSSRTKRPASGIRIINPRPEHFAQIQELCKKVYPFSKPWSLEQLASHRSYFPDGQLIALDQATNKVVGLAFSLIISWDDYSPQDNWGDFTSGGFFHNHNARKGKTLYGAEIMVDPQMRGRGIGKKLYEARRGIAEKYKLKRIRAGARLRGYSKFQERMTPAEYVNQVVEGHIYDPTLSFQIHQGFKVIDIAKNYLINDPESLGYAAVIEWLNPALATPTDIERQGESIEAFRLGRKFIPEFLPRELRRLVRKTTLALGQALSDCEGEKFYKKVENYRQQLKKVRFRRSQEQLKHLLRQLERESSENLREIVRAFSLQLELVNVCEAVYRTWRQRQKTPIHGGKRKLPLTFVLTAHPTEARPKELIQLLERIGNTLLDGAHHNFSLNERLLQSQVRLLWLHPLSRSQSPKVIDEAESLFSIVFSPQLFDFIISDKQGYEIELRTWVGGDKDGHPGVNAHVTRECFSESRKNLLGLVANKLDQLIHDLSEVRRLSLEGPKDLDHLKSLKTKLSTLGSVADNDGTRVKVWTLTLRKYLKGAHPLVKKHHQSELLLRLVDLYPALVMPIEVREDSGAIASSLNDKRAPIRLMLKELRKVSGALPVSCYVKGLVISHCEEASDLRNAAQLAAMELRTKSLPIVPLFESREALKTSAKILNDWLSSKGTLELARRHWQGSVEVMLGYSDSAKQVGLLASRCYIARAMRDIESTLKKFNLKPIIFHGSGGSVARGGGSLKEQIAWWPPSAITHPKQTIQGEMIQRLFASEEILHSQCQHMTIEANQRRSRKSNLKISPEFEKLSTFSEQAYLALVGTPDVINRLLQGTPYRYLEALKLGSRPSKRPTQIASLKSLRAIPWVLCWTQTRALLPSWWGVGSAWKSLNLKEQENLKIEFQTNPLISSYVKTLGFTLAKVELDVWELYNQSPESQPLVKQVREEFFLARQFLLEISGQKQELWYRPWLRESIQLRAPHIHILNLAQIIALKRLDEALLRDTVVGIASGMMTTG